MLTDLAIRKAKSKYKGYRLPDAIEGTLTTLAARLVGLRDGIQRDGNWTDEIISSEEIEAELLDEWLADEDEGAAPALRVEPAKLRIEIDELTELAEQARSIGTDTKTKALLTALDIGFQELGRMGAARKALVFTEFRRIQGYLRAFLEAHGYAGQVVTFSGTNADPRTKENYGRWAIDNAETGRATGSRAIDTAA